MISQLTVLEMIDYVDLIYILRRETAFVSNLITFCAPILVRLNEINI